MVTTHSSGKTVFGFFHLEGIILRVDEVALRSKWLECGKHRMVCDEAGKECTNFIKHNHLNYRNQFVTQCSTYLSIWGALSRNVSSLSTHDQS